MRAAAATDQSSRCLDTANISRNLQTVQMAAAAVTVPRHATRLPAAASGFRSILFSQGQKTAQAVIVAESPSSKWEKLNIDKEIIS